jgi:nicotinamide-nucleotide amidase
MHTEFVTIGTELLLGEIVDTNAARMALALRDIGMDIYYKTTVGDNEQRIVDVLNLALDRSDVVITSGGIGPTVDDITRQAVATATGRNLVYSKELERQVAARFRSFGREMAENNKRQAYMPEGATPIENPVGTAPCFLSEDTEGRGCVIVLPGVPRELEHLLENAVKPILIERMGGIKFTRVKVLRTCAVGESNVDRIIGDLMTESNPTVGLAAHIGQTDVRITTKTDTEEEADRNIAKKEAVLRERLGIAIYGEGKQTVAEVVGQLLVDRDLKIGVVDSLTNGQFARDIAESGYADRVAEVSSRIEETEGGESSAASMAELAARETGFGLAMVGPFDDNTTYMAVHGPGDSRLIKKSRNFQDSDHIRRWLTTQGLDWVRRVLLGQLTSPADFN